MTTTTADASATTLELTPKQHELLARGLKFVRSSVALGMSVPADETEAARRDEYAALDDLESQLASAAPKKPR